jgi:hypothetical protein
MASEQAFFARGSLNGPLIEEFD